MDIKAKIEQILKATTLSSYNKQIAIKCVWAVANVKEPDALKQLADNVMALICDLVKHKVILQFLDITLLLPFWVARGF